MIHWQEMRRLGKWSLTNSKIVHYKHAFILRTCTNVVNFKRPQSREGLLNKANTRPWYPSLLINIQTSYLLWQIVTQPCFSLRSTFWLGLLCKIEDDLNSSSPPHLLGKCFLRNFFRSSASIFEAATALWPRGGRGGAGQKWSTLRHCFLKKILFDRFLWFQTLER